MKTINITADSGDPLSSGKSLYVFRCDSLTFNITLKRAGEAVSLAANEKILLIAARTVGNLPTASANIAFAKEGAVGATSIVLGSSETSTLKSGIYRLSVGVESGENVEFFASIIVQVFETGFNGSNVDISVTSEFEQRMNSLLSQAQAAADAASISEQDANNAKNTAELAKEAASSFAADCAGYAATASTKATQAITAATEAMTSANFAAEVSRIAIVPITGTTQTIQPNKCYTLLTNDVDAYTLTPEMPSGNPEYLLQAVVQLKTGSAAPVINWGGNPSFFNGKIPTINADSSYDVIFEFDNITLSWSVGVMKK